MSRKNGGSVGKGWEDHDAFVIANVHVVDPAGERVAPGAVHVAKGKIEGVLAPGEEPEGAPRFDGGGLHVAPGFVDMHVHLREPGQEWKEDVASGTRAARAGGFTSVACMPNTDPAADEPSVIEFVRRRAQEAGHCRVYPVAAATVGRKGEVLTEFAALRESGAVAVSDDGAPVEDLGVLRRVFEYGSLQGLPYLSHPEDRSLSAGGCVHEGYWSTRLGLPGVPREAEEVAVEREIRLLEKVGGRLHLCHVHARGSVESVRRAKERGLAVTAETAPHYLSLDHRNLEGYLTEFKMNPPLGAEEDREALVAAVADGTIDAIATDHAPHSEIEKQVEFDRAPFGVTGLETAFAVVVTHLVRPGHLTLNRAVRLLTVRPARILGLEGGTLAAGSPADLALFDPDEEWEVTRDGFRSRSKNSPYVGTRLHGKVAGTFLGGRWLEA